VTLDEGTRMQEEKWSFEQMLRKTFKGPIDAIAGLLQRAGLTPNAITVFGLVVSIAAAVLLGKGKLLAGGLVLLIGAPMDALDGALARSMGKVTKFGAFLDSVTDRYQELIIFAGLLYHFLSIGNPTACLLVFAAAMGSVLISYIRARAESLGFDAKVGLLSRVGRLVILIPCLIFNIPLVALWILAIFTNLTAIQRFIHVQKQARQVE